MSDKNIQRPLTRRQRAYTRKEEQQVKLIYNGVYILVGIVGLVFFFGLAQRFFIEPNSSVAVVNGENIILSEYQDRVLYERFVLDQQYQQIVQELETQDQSEENQQILGFYRQIANQVLQQRALVDQQTLDVLIEETLIEAEAGTRQISVTDDEVNERINREMARRQGGLTEASAEETRQALAEASPTPTQIPPPTLEPSENVTVTVAPPNTPTPAPTPTLNVIDSGTLSGEYTAWLTALSEATIDEATYREVIRQQVLREKVEEAISEEAPNVAEQSRARHILISPDPELIEPLGEDATEEEQTAYEEAVSAAQAEAEATAATEALAVYDQLQSGEDFATLAEQFSDDPGSAAEGGDLGFVVRGRFVPEVDDAVFSLPLGEVSEPIQSQFGWHIIEVLEREERELSPADYQQQQQQTVTDWLSNARDNAELEDYWTREKAPRDTFFGQQ